MWTVWIVVWSGVFNRGFLVSLKNQWFNVGFMHIHVHKIHVSELHKKNIASNHPDASGCI